MRHPQKTFKKDFCKVAKISVTFLTVPLLFGCVRWHCPAFPEDLTQYAPYMKNQVLKFTDGEGHIISMMIDLAYKTNAEDIRYNCKCTCETPFHWVEFKYNDDIMLNYIAMVPLVDGEEMDMDGKEFMLNSYEFTPFDLESISIAYCCHQADSTLLFTSKSDPCYFDSVKFVKGIGMTEFCALDGGHYHIVKTNDN